MAHHAKPSDSLARYAPLVDELTLEEKVHLLSGESVFALPGNETIGLAPMSFSDGPTGVRGSSYSTQDAVVLLPNPTLISSSWDDDVAREAGRILSEEAERQHIHVVLGPTINLHRSPLGGRLFESYSEDPYLTGRTASAYTNGMQANGTSVCPKHLVANESETLRNFVDSRVSDAALREVYLLPFEMAVQDAHAWSLMAAYNRVNGVAATAHDLIQNQLVKGEWGWDGLIMSDWWATKTTTASANGGLDLVMPGPRGPWGDRLVAAVRAGEVAEEAVNEHVARLLLLAERVGALAPEGEPERTWRDDVPAVDSARRREQLRRLAVRGMTVVKNDGALPLDGGGTVALIGRHAVDTVGMGGGSAHVTPPYISSVADALTDRWGDRVTVWDGPQVRTRPVAAEPAFVTDPETGTQGVRVRVLAADGGELADYHSDATQISVSGEDGQGQDPARIELRATLGNEAGPARLGGLGGWTWTIEAPGHEITSRLGLGSKDPSQTFIVPPAFQEVVDLPARATVTATVGVEPIDWREELLGDPQLGLSEESHLLDLAHVGAVTLAAAQAHRPDEDLIADAVDAARRAGTAVVVVGLTDQDESEGADKTTLALPGRQDELVERVAEAAERTVVVVNAATPVLMPWLEKVDSVLIAGLPGQEAGRAIAAALTGDLEPTGRLVTSFPAADGRAPAWDLTPDANLELAYEDGTFIGHRGYYAGHAPAPLFWFGHGLGYGRWEYGRAWLSSLDPLEVSVELTNIFDRDSRETVQIYLDPAEQDQPVRLVGYQGVDVAAGRRVTVTVRCDDRLRRRWDGTAGAWKALEGGELIVARGLGDIRARVSLG